jgi:hypothetical protein
MISRSGRRIKKPEVYTPQEEVEDDYAEDDYDSNLDDSDIDTDEEHGSEDDFTDDEMKTLTKTEISRISSSMMTMTKMRNFTLKKMKGIFRYGSRHRQPHRIQ